MRQKTAKAVKRSMKRHATKFQKEGMEIMISYIESQAWYERIFLCWDIMRKKNLRSEDYDVSRARVYTLRAFVWIHARLLRKVMEVRTEIKKEDVVSKERKVQRT